MAIARKTILFFGDQTDEWTEGIDFIRKEAPFVPWLRKFMVDACKKLQDEIKHIRQPIVESLGSFTSLYDLAELYRHTPDEIGFANAFLIYVMRAAMLLRCVKREPELLDKSQNGPEWLGISGGLMSLAPLAIAKDFDSLYAGCLEVAGLLCRVSNFCFIQSRAVQDKSGTWGWAVLGISNQDLRSALDKYQKNLGIPPLKRAHVAVTGDRWASVIGPPTVLEQFLRDCPAVNGLAKNRLNIRSLQHAIPMSDSDLDYIVGNSDMVTRNLEMQQHRIWGTDNPDATYGTLGALLRGAVSQCVSRPLDIVAVVNGMREQLDPCEQINIKVIGTSGHISYLAAALEKDARLVTVQHEIGANQKADDAQSLDKVAIVGMAGRGPGCDDLDEFWNVLLEGKDMVEEIPVDRFDLDEFFAAKNEHDHDHDEHDHDHGHNHGHNHKHNGARCTTACRFGCFMKKPGNFDARFFRISPREAMFMDPGHRQFLMASYEALETAGYSDGRTKSVDPSRIAVFFGQSNDDWNGIAHYLKGCDAYTLQGAQRAFGAGRLAFQMGWEGPTYSTDSACATSSSSLHLACLSLLSRDIDMAVCGAANVVAYPHSWTSLGKSGILSNTGNCKPFRDDADGYCRADFVGSVVLKRLGDAIAHNDNILAVISGSGRNHSGNSRSMTTSDAGAQARLLHRVLRTAGVSADDVSYVEMHGTGTQTGDRAEMGAVSQVFQHRRADNLVIGSIKANIGHSEAAAGMSSLFKCVLMLQKGVMPPQAGMPHALNPNFPPLQRARMEILSASRDFKPQSAKIRRAMLNNFDAAGGNACLLLEEYKNKSAADTLVNGLVQVPWQKHAVVLSARSASSLKANKQRLLEYIKKNPDTRLQDVAYTTTARRVHHPIRAGYLVSSMRELMSSLASEESLDQDNSSKAAPAGKPSVVLVFTGQGSVHGGMGSQLYRTSSMFREKVMQCARICADHGFPPFMDIITDEAVDLCSKDATQTQLALLTLEISLAFLWQSQAGLTPSMVMGHSLGEYAALYISRVLSLTDVLYLVGKRAQLLEELCDTGSCAMLAVATSSHTAQQYIDASWNSHCSISCCNAPKSTVIGGLVDDIERLQMEMSGFSPRKLSVPYAFHSFQMDPILEQFANLANGVTFSAPQIPVASTLLAKVVDAEGVFNSTYIAQQTRHQVQFCQTVQAVDQSLGEAIWLEIGPAQTCGSFVKAILNRPAPGPRTVISTLDKESTDWASFARCLIKLYEQGVDIDWLGIYSPYRCSVKLLATLPTYGWDLQEFWITHTEKARNLRKASWSPPSSDPTPRQISISTCAQAIVEQTSSPEASHLVMRTSLADPAITALLEGHRIRQVAICPASVFCDAALTAAQHLFQSSGKIRSSMGAAPVLMTIRNLSLQSPLGKQPDARTAEEHFLIKATTVLPLLNASSANDASVSFHHRDRELGSCTVSLRDQDTIQSCWSKTSVFIKARLDSLVAQAKQGCGHRIRSDMFYALFASTVQYSAEFKRVREAYVSEDFSEAAAEITLGSDPDGTRFASSPYHGDSLVHLAGFLLNSDPARPRSSETTFMMGNLENLETLGTPASAAAAGKTYLTLARVFSRAEQSAVCDVWVFDKSSSELVMSCLGLGFHEVRNMVLDSLLGRNKISAQASSKGQVRFNALPRIRTADPAAAAAAAAATKSGGLGQRNNPSLQRSYPSLQWDPEPSRDQAKYLAHQPFASILENIAGETGIDISQLTDDTVVADIGVDSIMAIEITAAVKRQTGIDLGVTALIEHPTVGALRRAFELENVIQDSETSDLDLDLDLDFNFDLDFDTAHSSASPTSSSGWTPTTPSETSHGRFSLRSPGEKEDSVRRPLDSSDARLESQALPPQNHAIAPVLMTKDKLNGLPPPKARLVLLHGRPPGNRTPLYLIADGTGSIASYLHLPPFNTKSAVIYGIDSPFIRSPERIGAENGMWEAAQLIVDAILQSRPEGPLYIGGFSGGGMLSYEVARQLADLGRRVQGLLIMDMCSPRSHIKPSLVHQVVQPEDGLEMFQAMAAQEHFWSANSQSLPMQHLLNFFTAVARYHPEPMTAKQRPKRISIIWAEKGMGRRCAARDPELKHKMVEMGFPATPYPGFMEDPTLGAFAWAFVDKHGSDGALGPNGWDKYVGNVGQCLSVAADHLEMLMPGHAHLVKAKIDQALEYFESSGEE